MNTNDLREKQKQLLNNTMFRFLKVKLNSDSSNSSRCKFLEEALIYMMETLNINELRNNNYVLTICNDNGNKHIKINKEQ